MSKLKILTIYPLFSRGYKNPKSHSQAQSQEAQSYFQFRFANEKIISLENKEFERDSFDFLDTNLNADYIINNYSITYSLKFDPYLNKYDTFSKKHHREKLYKLINDLDWENEYKIKVLKKEVNPYEDVFESYFDRRSSYKMANVNSLFKFQLFSPDYLMGYTPIMVVGDDGGFSDYIMWYANNSGFTTRIFAVPEKNAKIFKTAFRKEIDESKDEYLNIINVQKGLDIDEIEDFSSPQIEALCEDIITNTDGVGVSLFLARKFIKFKKEFNQEIKYKKFLLLNLIIGLSTLSKGGNFVIKIYDMYTHFTNSVLFILFNYFEKFTIIKPFSTRPHTSGRFVVCQKLTELKPKILSYLYDLYDKYINELASGRDIDFIYPISKVIKDENFTGYVLELNSLITEQRIESLEEIKTAYENQTLPKFDKMDIKKKCLELWKVPILHYDPRLIVTGRNILEEKNKKREQSGKGMNKLTSIQDTIKIYSEYDKYSDSLRSMIDMYGKNKVVGSIDDNKKKNEYREREREKEREKERESAKKYPREEKVKSQSKSDSKKKTSSGSKLEELKQRVIAEREANNGTKSNATLDAAESEELLRKKREMLMASFTDSSSKSKTKKEPKKKSFATPSYRNKPIEVSQDRRLNTSEKTLDKSESPITNPKDILKLKEKKIEESMKNRQAAESKKVTPNEKLMLELEKYKKK